MRPERICLVIDCLGLGGAQRQLVSLALMLREHWRNVEIVSYHATNPTDNYFAEQVVAAGVGHHLFAAGTRLDKLLGLRRLLARNRPDVVIAYLPTPSALSELTWLTHPRFRLIVSERAASPTPLPFRERLRFQLHRIADRVVCNSFTQAAVLSDAGLASRTRVIANQVDTDRFRPAPGGLPNGDRLEIVTLANYTPNKNPDVVIDGLAASDLRDRVRCQWWGNPSMPNSGMKPSREYYDGLRAKVSRAGLGTTVVLNGVCGDPAGAYRAADAFCLASFSEGSSNALAEALACGLPVLCSRVKDHPRILRDGENGFLFDPAKPEEFGNAVRALLACGPAGRERMGKTNRALAERLFSPAAFASNWNALIAEVLS